MQVIDTRPKQAERPERLDLDEPPSLLRPLWRESAQGALRTLLTGRPDAPPGARLAPEPDDAEPILGHLRLGRNDPLTSFTRWRGEKGDVVRLRLAGVTAHLLGHPRHARWVLQEGNKHFIKPIQGRRNLADVLGNGLLVSEGSFWLRQRRIAQPAFHKRRIDGFAERMVDAAEALEAEWAERGDARFDVSRDLMRATLRVVEETILGARSIGDADEIRAAVTIALEEVNMRFRRILQVPPKTPVIGNPKYLRALETLDRTVLAIIAERRRRPGGDDLLSMLLETRDEETGERMDDRQLKDEVMTMFLAGHETTANALSWTYVLLGRHPAVARRMREEIAEVIGDRRPTAEDLKALPYTKAVFQEAMRLYPPAWILARAPIEDTEIDGYFIPSGTRLFISPYVLHRHPDVWPDPEGFDPSRFLGEPEHDRFGYLPFGAGPRLCIGHAFAMMEGVLMLATLSRRFRLELVPGHPIVPEALVTLRPKHGVLVRAVRC